MSLLGRLIEAGTPPDLIEEVAMLMAEKRAAENAIEERKAKARERQARKRERDSQSRDVTECHVTERDVTQNTLDKKSPHTPKKIKPKNTPPIVPPRECEDEWAAYEEMRRRIRKPMTDHARRLALEKLKELAAEGHPPAQVLNQSVMNSYQGLFPLKDREKTSAGEIW